MLSFMLVVAGFAVTSAASSSKSFERVFARLDVNGDGVFAEDEMYRRFSEKLAMATARGDADALMYPHEALAAIADTMDANGDGIVTLRDFNRPPFAISDGNTSVVEQVRLSLTGVETEMRVMFVVMGARPVPNCVVEVEVGMPGGGTTEWVPFNTTAKTYAVPVRWWEPAGWEGWIYTATVTGLQPGQAYSYRIVTPVGNRTQLRMVIPSSASSPSSSSSSLPYTHLAVWGDMGTTMPLGFKVFDQMLADHARGGDHAFNATMLFGDIAYAGVDSDIGILNITSADEWEYVWDLFGEQIEPLASEVPFMVGVGNHDVFYGAAAYSARFHMPWEHSAGNESGFWHSFDIGGVHVIASSSEHDYSSLDSPQMRWLAADLELATANRAQVPWIVFTLHKPMYCSDADTGGAVLRRQAFEQLLLKYAVDLVLVGHEHSYERIHPVSNGTVVDRPSTVGGEDVYRSPPAPVHLVIGTAGALQEERFENPKPDWSAVRFANGGGYFYTDTYGYGDLKAFNATHLRFAFVPISGGGVINDTFWIIKGANETK